METSIKLGRIWGIPIGLNWSWFLIFSLITWSLAMGYFPAEYPDLPAASYWLLGVLTSVLFFASVLLHELGHAFFALRDGIPVRSISLFLFGGVAQVNREPNTAASEFRIAIAGPLVSLILAALFAGLWLLDREVSFLAALSIWLARINLILALFNLIPGFPLDGGRVLRALIWQATGDLRRATRIAAFTGQLVAFGFIGFGVFALLSGNFFNGLWLAFIGWFLQNAAASANTQVDMQQTLNDVQVEQVMATGHPRVLSYTSLDQLVSDNVLSGGHRYFIVADNGHPNGLLTLRDVTAVPRPQWGQTIAGQVMVPWPKVIRVRPETPLSEALQIMDETGKGQLPVVNAEEQVLGFLSREHILHYLRTRAELNL